MKQVAIMIICLVGISHALPLSKRVKQPENKLFQQIKAINERIQENQDDKYDAKCVGIQGIPGPAGPAGEPGRDGADGNPGPKGDPADKRPTQCPAGFTRNDSFNSCYMATCVEPASWYDALSVCNGLGANLAVVESEEEDDWILNGLMQPNSWFWYAGNQLLGEWLWFGNPPKAIEYDGWDKMYKNYSRPQPENNLEKCMMMRLKNGENGWHDGFCRSARCYICEVNLQAKIKVL